MGSVIPYFRAPKRDPNLDEWIYQHTDTPALPDNGFKPLRRLPDRQWKSKKKIEEEKGKKRLALKQLRAGGATSAPSGGSEEPVSGASLSSIAGAEASGKPSMPWAVSYTHLTLPTKA